MGPPMNPSKHDADTTTDSQSVDCATLELDSGVVVIYNPENNRAWIQSDAAVALQARL